MKMKWKFFAAAGIAIFLLSGFIFYAKSEAKHAADNPPGILLSDELTRVTVYVTGAVKKPGNYTLSQGSRVESAIKAAGGPAQDWDPESINLAKRLNDEDMVVVPRKSGKQNSLTPNLAHGFSKKPAARGKISINRAGILELEALPGVGPGMAERILAYRQSHGAFSSIEEIKSVPGLGEKKFEMMKQYLQL